jgi:hypothetical protein
MATRKKGRKPRQKGRTRTTDTREMRQDRAMDRENEGRSTT